MTEEIEKKFQSEVSTELQEVSVKSAQAEKKLKSLTLWSEKYLRLVEEMSVDKKVRTQNIRGLSSLERITKIIQNTRKWVSSTLA